MGFRIAAVGVVIALSFTGALQAAIPVDPNAVTEHAFRAALLDFNRRTSVETYKQVGKRDPKWDEPAIAFLEAMARYFANYRVATRYRINPVPTLKELEAQGRAVVALGCDDPLILYGLAAALDNQNKRSEARPLLDKVFDELPKSRYPINRLSAVAHRMLKHYDRIEEKAAYARCEQLLSDATLAAISVGDLQGLDRRAFYFVSSGHINSLPLPVRRKFCEDAKAVGADPWLVNMFEAAYHLAAAYAAPGSAAGRRASAEHARLAAACYTKAWELEPSYPEPASNMILIAMRAGPRRQGPAPREWFDRAVAAQFDHEPAYHHYLQAIDDSDERIAFGLECAATQRYDTRVPHELIDVVEAVIDSQGASPEFVRATWQRPGVYDAAAEVLRAYAEQPAESSRRGWYLSYAMSVAVHARQFDGAAAILNQADGKIDWTPVDATRGIAPRLNHQVRAMAGTRAAALREAEAAADTGAFDKALESYEAALAALPPGDPSTGWVNHRLAELRLLKQFATGAWVDLQPTGPHIFGWYGAGGKWSVDEQGRLVGTSHERNGLHFVCGAEFGAQYEMTGTLEYVSVGKVADPAGGPILRYSRDADSNGLWLRKGSQRVVVRTPGGHTKGWPATVGDSNTFRVQVWDGHAFGWVNGEPAFNDHAIRGLAAAETTRVGVGAQYNHGSETIVLRFSDLKIRKLDKPPLVRNARQPDPPPPTRDAGDAGDL